MFQDRGQVSLCILTDDDLEFEVHRINLRGEECLSEHWPSGNSSLEFSLT